MGKIIIKFFKKNIILIVILFSFVLIVPIYLLRIHHPPASSNNNKTTSRYHTIAQPAHITIPKLHITTAIESVGKDAEGRMDVPQNVMNTAWYSLGPKPGEIGNVVIDGHLDTRAGKPAVFYNLSSLKKGDLIEILDYIGNMYDYRVISIHTYSVDNFPSKSVFGQYAKARLNLITCAGDYNKDLKSYNNRIVVFSELDSIKEKK